jgi:TPR repeat protein
MKLSRVISPLALCLLLPLSGCSQSGSQATAATQPTTVTADGRKLRPLTDLEVAQDAYSKGDYPKALDHFRAAATAGDADAMYYTGVMYSEAEGVAKKDMAEAIRWYEKAAARDQPAALYAMGRLYVTGFGVDLDQRKAVEFFDRSAKAYPPGEDRDRVEQQRAALVAVLDGTQPTSTTTVTATAPATTSPAKK